MINSAQANGAFPDQLDDRQPDPHPEMPGREMSEPYMPVLAGPFNQDLESVALQRLLREELWHMVIDRHYLNELRALSNASLYFRSLLTPYRAAFLLDDVYPILRPYIRYELDSDALRNIFPAEIWCTIFQCLEPEGKREVCNSSLYFREILANERTAFLFYDVLAFFPAFMQDPRPETPESIISGFEANLPPEMWLNIIQSAEPDVRRNLMLASPSFRQQWPQFLDNIDIVQPDEAIPEEMLQAFENDARALRQMLPDQLWISVLDRLGPDGRAAMSDASLYFELLQAQVVFLPEGEDDEFATASEGEDDEFDSLSEGEDDEFGSLSEGEDDELESLSEAEDDEPVFQMPEID